MSTRTTNRPTPLQDPTPGPADPASRRPRLDLSVAQTVGGSLAAATAAAIGSRLGVVGTLTGAALVSVVASVAGALYTNSLRRTGHRVSSALRTVRGGRPGAGTPLRARRVLAGALTVFAVAAVGITAFELATGTSLSGRHGSTTAATALQGGGTHRAPAHPTPARPSPHATSTPTPSSSPTSTPSSAPSGPAAVVPSSAAPTPSESPAASPTGADTAAPPPSASPTAAPTPGSTPGTLSPSAVPAGPQGP